jgi:hypothetical protein
MMPARCAASSPARCAASSRGLWLALAGALTLLLIGVSAAVPAPPANADPELMPWFNSLESPGGSHCCGPETDCRAVPYRVAGGHYEALLDPAVHAGAKNRGIEAPIWIRIPDGAILRRHDNPTGRAILCWRPYYAGEDAGAGTLCFVRPPES